jgi:hypothetical protein
MLLPSTAQTDWIFVTEIVHISCEVGPQFVNTYCMKSFFTELIKTEFFLCLLLNIGRANYSYDRYTDQDSLFFCYVECV